MPYPTDEAGRRQLADELTAKGFKPTQQQKDFERDKIDKMMDDMLNGSFNWNRASLRPIILGPDSQILGGHHRVIAAHLAGIDLTAIAGPRPQIQTLPRSFRPEYHWIDELPEVQ